MTEAEPNARGVSRLRRAIFTWIVVGASMLIPSAFVMTGKDGKLAETVADGLLTLGMSTAFVYIGGSSADFIATRWSRRGQHNPFDDDPRWRPTAVSVRERRTEEEVLIEK